MERIGVHTDPDVDYRQIVVLYHIQFSTRVPISTYNANSNKKFVITAPGISLHSPSEYLAIYDKGRTPASYRNGITSPNIQTDVHRSILVTERVRIAAYIDADLGNERDDQMYMILQDTRNSRSLMFVVFKVRGCWE